MFNLHGLFFYLGSFVDDDDDYDDVCVRDHISFCYITWLKRINAFILVSFKLWSNKKHLRFYYIAVVYIFAFVIYILAQYYNKNNWEKERERFITYNIFADTKIIYKWWI